MEQNNLKTNTQTTNQNNANEQRPGRSKRRKSYGDIIKSRYAKACFILAKIENNSRNGTPHENDESDRQKFQLVVDECLKYQESKAEVKKEVNEAPKEMKKETTEIIRDEVSMAPNKEYVPKDKKNKKPTKVITDELCMALANESNGQLKPVVAEWPMIENEMSNILYKYLLHNKSCPIPRYDSGEIYRGFFLIQCKDTFSKDFLSNCVTKVRDAFKGFSLTLIPAAQIPEGGFDDKTFNTLTTNANTNIECKEEEFIVAPPPPTWQNDTAETKLDMEDRKEDIDKIKLLDKNANNCYQNYLQRYQYFTNKGKLKSRDKKKLRRCERKIRNFEIRHGIRKEIDDEMNTPQQNEGFQLSVNYFDTDDDNLSRDSMADNPFRRDFPQTSRSSYDHEFEGLNNQQPEEEECFTGRHISSKTKSNYKRALRFLRNLTEFTDLTYKQQKYKNKYLKMIKRYEQILGINNEMLDYPETQTSNDFRGQYSGWNYHDWDEENYNEMERDGAEFPELEQMSGFTQNSSSWNYGEPEAAGYNEMRRDYTTIRQRIECTSTARNNFEPELEQNFTSNRHRTAYPSTEQMSQRFSTERSNFEPKLETISDNFTSNKHGAVYPATARSKIKTEIEQMPHKMPNSSWNHEAAGNEMRANHSTSNRPRSDFTSTASNSLMSNKMSNSSWNYETAGNEMRGNHSTSNRPRSDFSSTASNSLMPPKIPNTSWNYEAAGNEMRANQSTSNIPRAEFSSSHRFENEPRQIQTLVTNKMPNSSWNYGHPEVESYNKTSGNSGQRSVWPQTITSQFHSDVSNQNIMRNSSLVECAAAGRSPLNIDLKTKANTLGESKKTMLEKQIYDFLNNIGDEEDPEELSYTSVKPSVAAELKRKSDSSRKSPADRFDICQPNNEDKPTTSSRRCDPRKTLTSYPVTEELKPKSDSSRKSPANRFEDKTTTLSRSSDTRKTSHSFTSAKTPVAAELKRKSDSSRKSSADRFDICQPNNEDKPTASSRRCDPRKTLTSYPITEELKPKSDSSTKSPANRFEDKTKTLSRSSDPRKTSHAYTSMRIPVTAELKRKADSSKTSSKTPHAMEVISLSDDSDCEQDRARQEYYKALGYLRKLESLDPHTLSEQETRFQETSRFMVRQFENQFGLKANKSMTSTAHVSNEEVSMASREKRSRRSFPTNSDMVPTTQKPGEHSRSWTFENTKSYPQTSSSSWQNSNEMYTKNPRGDMPESPRSTIDNDTYPTITNNPDLQIAIIDRNEKDFKIPKISWSKIEQELLQALVHEVERTNNTNIAMFDGMHWKYGIKIVQCENMESLNFIKRFIIKLSLKSTGAQYDVIPVKELPRRSIVKVSIPPPNLDDNAIFKILKAQNHTLYTLDWTLINSREMSNKNGKNLYISISSTSLRRLRQIKGEIRYGINRLQVELPQEDDEASGGNFE
ncbi:uncharacterized protein LOC135958912 [Calliphora vicina]|uniref:uncharacterized protein LOC135958912 n=1 Tax=Calliphora vicina TaxID=7373 RepID=UPI00325B82FC